MSESGDPGHEQEPTPPDAPLSERDRRDLRAMGSRPGWVQSFPSGCLVSIVILFCVFFLIVSVCSRV